MNRIGTPLLLAMCASVAVVAASWDSVIPSPIGPGIAAEATRPGLADLVVHGLTPHAEVGAESDMWIDARGSGRLRYTVASGNMPEGVTLSADGRLVGRYAAVGEYSALVAAVDPAGTRSTVRFALTVLPPVPELTLSFDADPVPGRAFRATVSGPAGYDPTDWALDSGPSWIKVSADGATAVVSGTVPADARTLSFTIAGTDPRGRVAYAGSGDMPLTPSVTAERSGETEGAAFAVGPRR